MSGFLKQMLLISLISVSLVQSTGTTRCKSTPDSPSWPPPSAWNALNTSISGRLLRPSPPGAVCHPDQATYNTDTCRAVQVLWLNSTFHADDPVSVDYENWTNDTCLPSPDAPCSGAGYPVYVVNASTADHVKAGVDFARNHSVRLIVKASGHDYLGRSSAPNALSIWVRHLSGVSLSSNFQPQGCNFSLNESSITVGAGVLMGDIYRALRPHNLTIVGGMAQDISIGGYLTGGGHNAISPVYGLGADNVFEMEVVTPRGEIVTANECRNTDLFWALRGGGGGTFGVVTKASLRTFRSPAVSTLTVTLSAPASASDAYWSTITYLFQQIPALVDAGVSGYFYTVPAGSPSLPAGVSGPVFYALLVGVDRPASVISDALAPVAAYGKGVLPPDAVFSTAPAQYADFFDFWWVNRDSSNVGYDVMLGSRLLNGAVLSGVPFHELKSALVAFAGTTTGFNGIMVTGKGVWDAKPRGGGNAVNPAWRNNTMVHLVTGVAWPPRNTTAMHAQLTQLEAQTGALRKLAPDSGCYLNEADADEPDYQHAFWGSHYARLQKIKRALDPDGVLWCHPCVGDEGWTEEEGGKVCQIG